ncbi:MAG: protein kinase [Rhabdochlamydiaceae bacterium]|nr:protein kinase [Rhabdochlamydiaceae bacterium]
MLSVVNLEEYGVYVFKYDKTYTTKPTQTDPEFFYYGEIPQKKTKKATLISNLVERSCSPAQSPLDSPSAPRRKDFLSKQIVSVTNISKKDVEALSEELLTIYAMSKEPECRNEKYNGIKFKRKETGFRYSYLLHGNNIFVHLHNFKNRGNFKSAKNALMIQLPSCKVEEIIHKKIRSQTKLGEKEANLQSQLSHRSIPKIYAVHKYTNTQESRVSVYEQKCEQTGETMFLNDELSEFDQKVQFFHEIARGVSYLHFRGLCHNDLKLDNIMIRNGKGMLIDFGLTTQAGANPFNSCPWTCAPERQHPRAPVSFASDIYQFGLMLAQAFIPDARPLISVKNPTLIPSIEKVLFNWLPAPEKENKMKRLIDACLSANPQERPTIEDINSVLRNL